MPARKRRDALPIEKLGEYDPIPRLPSRPSDFNPDLSSINMRALFANGPVKGIEKEKKIVWNTERIKWWLANGAQPSETVVGLLERVSNFVLSLVSVSSPAGGRFRRSDAEHILSVSQGGLLVGNHKWKVPAKKQRPKPSEKSD
jgi:ribosomal protein S16